MTASDIDYAGLRFDGSVLTTHTFEGIDLIVQFHPEMGSFVTLRDLCEIHQCGTPNDILDLLQQCGGGCWDPCDMLDYTEDPGISLVNLDNHDLMGTIRSHAKDWGLAVRFRNWLVAQVFHVSPHIEYDARKTAMLCHVDGSRFRSWDEVRNYWWHIELQQRPRHARHALRLVWPPPTDA